MTKLSVYVKNRGRNRVRAEVWELHDPSTQNDPPSVTWWTEQPKTTFPFSLSGNVSVADWPVGILDVHGWMFDGNEPRWEWRLNREALSQIEEVETETTFM
jgi:hypothetical protein